ncbi:MAG: hypothetical protein M3680_08790 [Myxococcota bacterium]|nr:hypothetical protein [Myxococcota bacterium]
MTIKKFKITLATAALVLGSLTGLAAARGLHGADKQAMKEKFDVDKNGTIDDAERAKLKEAFAAMRAQHKAEKLAKFDANRNGTLDDAERTAMRNARSERRFAKLDVNRDGKLTIDEFKAARGHGKGNGMRGHRGMHKQP